MEIVELHSIPEWRELRNLLKEGAIKKSDKGVLSEVELNMFRGVRTWVGLVGNEPVSVNCTNIGKKGHNVWRPNANWYTSYTRVGFRRQGYARALAVHARKVAVEAGCRRLRSKAGTVLGVRLHQSMGDQFWALTAKHELLVDTPINPDVQFPDGVPPDTKPGKNDLPHLIYGDAPLTPEQVELVLASYVLAYDKE